MDRHKFSVDTAKGSVIRRKVSMATSRQNYSLIFCVIFCYFYKTLVILIEKALLSTLANICDKYERNLTGS